MMKKILFTCLIMTFCFTLFQGQQAFSKTKELKISNGFVQYNGVRIPVVPGVKKVTETPEDSVYANALTFDIKTKDMKESEKQAQAVMDFYMGKKIGDVTINGEFQKSGSGEEIYYNSTSKSDSGKTVNILVVVMKQLVSVVLMPD